VYDYEGTRRICYGDDNAQFVPVCPKCGRFVKAPLGICFDGLGQPEKPNAECKKCGPISMPFEGYL
jgi:hypothetical protein